MLGFLKGFFGEKGQGGFDYYAPPLGTSIHDLNVGAVVVAANDKGHDALKLHGVELSAKGVAKLSTMKTLRALDLTGAKVDDTALAALKGCTMIEYLNLSKTRINGSCFVKIGALPNLVTLDLSDTNVVDKALLALRSATKLRELDLSTTKLTDRVLDYIGQLKSVRVLKLRNMQLDGAALAMLMHNSDSLQIID